VACHHAGQAGPHQVVLDVVGAREGWPWLPAWPSLRWSSCTPTILRESHRHATAFFVPFLTVPWPLGRRLFRSLIFAFFSNLCVCLTHYGGAPPSVLRCRLREPEEMVGRRFSCLLFYIVVWMGIGPFYWKPSACSSERRPTANGYQGEGHSPPFFCRFSNGRLLDPHRTVSCGGAGIRRTAGCLG